MSRNKLEKAMSEVEAVSLDLHKALDALKSARKHNRGVGVTEARVKAETVEAALETAFDKAMNEWRALPWDERGDRPQCKALERAELII